MNIPDFTDTDRKIVSRILLERYNRLVTIQSADVELQLTPPNAPALQGDQTAFVLAEKAGGGCTDLVANQLFTAESLYADHVKAHL